MADEYCPNGWSVKRNADYSAVTCDPMDPSRKCAKPFSCVHSHCDLNFCCVNDSSSSSRETSSERKAQFERAEEIKKDREEAEAEEDEL